MDSIEIVGAKVNNLKSVNLNIPLKKLVCINGPSGSGKTSLAFHTIYAESKRRFFNSFPNSMKLFADRPTPVDVEKIYPVLPVFALPQINPVMGSRNNIADIMRLTELLQGVLYHHSKGRCSTHDIEYEEIGLKDKLNKIFEDKKIEKIHLFITKEEFYEKFSTHPRPTRCWYRNKIQEFSEEYAHWEVSRFKLPITGSSEARMAEFSNLKNIYVTDEKGKLLEELSFSNLRSCKICGETEKIFQPQHFNPQNALGACKKCNGYGATLEYDEDKLLIKELSVKDGGIKFLNYKRFDHLNKYLIDELKKLNIPLDKPIKHLPKNFIELLYNGKGKFPGFNKLFEYLEGKKYKASVRIFLRGIQTERICPSCDGLRINSDVLERYFFEEKIKSILNKSIDDFSEFFKEIKFKDQEFSKIFDDINYITNIAQEIGLGHLNLIRKVKSVSAGEYQRLLLVKYLSFKGTDALFIFDEPSLGLNIDEQKFILKQFQKLIADGNSVILIEHSKFLINNSDFLITMGPLAGNNGGQVIYSGKTIIQEYLSKDLKIPTKKFQNYIKAESIEVYGKKYQSIELPTNAITLVKGKSGSGKTSVIVHGIANTIADALELPRLTNVDSKIKNLKYPSELKDILYIDSDLTRFSSRSTVGTLTDLSTPMRNHYTQLDYSKKNKLEKGHFSPNSMLGQCQDCQGSGVKIIEMQYLEDIVVECEVCKGKKLKPEYADISDGKYTVSKAYQVPIADLFKNIKCTPKYKKILEYLEILNLNYLSLERKIQSLSGGERQRIFLLSKLLAPIENQLLIFENISFGLSENEIIKFTEFLNILKQKNNTIIIIDQNPDLEVLVDNMVTI